MEQARRRVERRYSIAARSILRNRIDAHLIYTVKVGGLGHGIGGAVEDAAIECCELNLSGLNLIVERVRRTGCHLHA